MGGKIGHDAVCGPFIVNRFGTPTFIVWDVGAYVGTKKETLGHLILVSLLVA